MLNLPQRWFPQHVRVGTHSLGRLRPVLLLLLLVSLASGGSVVAQTSAAPTAGQEFLVKFRKPVAPAAAARFAQSYGGARRVEIAQLGVHVLSFRGDLEQHALLARLQADPVVEYVEVNAAAVASVVPNDPGYPNQWGLAKIKAAQGWDIQIGSQSVVIAVVDTGVDPGHPDLSGKSVPGWNYDAFSPGYNTADTTDNNGHGTHVAGIAAAATDNSLGVAGTCLACVFMPVKVLGSDGSGTYDAVASGIVYAADNGARVINLSLGGNSPSQTLEDAVNYAYTRGTLLVAAAGNNGSSILNYPAAYANVMAIAATDTNDGRATFSNYGSHISVAAPGVDIYSTYWSAGAGSSYAYKSGTSMATPYVAGLAGLVVSQDTTRTNVTLRSIIERAADDVAAAGWDQYTGYGRINAARALSGSVLGNVTDAVTGATLVNAQVEALQNGQLKASTTTLSDGTYRLQYLLAGAYEIRVTLAGYTSQTRTDVIVESGQNTANVDFALTRVGAISGKVTSGRKALSGATVQAIQGTEVLGSATTDKYGYYQISNLAAGTYDVQASASGYKSQTKTGINVVAGQTTTGINFSLSR